MKKQTTPIFIVGFPRSGTTLLAQIIGSDSNILCFSTDPPWWSAYYRVDRFRGEYRTEAQRLKLVNELLSLKKVSIAIGRREKENIRRRVVLDKPGNFAELTEIILRNWKSKKGETRWAYKEPVAMTEVRTILGYYPEAKIIFIFRDCRDVIVSARSRGWSPHTGYYLNKWLEAMRLDEEYKREIPKNYYSLKYKDLVTRPKEEVRKICRFLEIEFSEALLAKFEGWSYHKNNTVFDDVPDKEISISPVGRYRDQLPIFDMACCQAVAGKVLVAHGYKLEQVDKRVMVCAYPWGWIAYYGWGVALQLLEWSFKLGVKNRLGWVNAKASAKIRASVKKIHRL